MKRKKVKMGQQIYTYLVIIFFVGPGVAALKVLGALDFSFHLLFMGSLLPFVSHEYITRKWGSLSWLVVINRNLVVIVSLVIITSFSLVSVFFGRWFFVEGVKSEFHAILVPLIIMGAFLFAIKFGSSLPAVNCYRNALIVATTLASLSIIGHALNPGIFDQLYQEETKYAVGFLRQRNEAAMLVVLSCASSLNYYQFKFTDILVISVSTFAVISTLSRAGMILCVISILFYSVTFFLSKKKINVTNWLKLSALVAGLCAFVVVSNDLFFDGGIWERKMSIERITAFSQLGTSAMDDQIRRDMINQSLEHFFKSPLWGTGAWFHQSESFGFQGPHNEFIKYTLDYGIPGGLAYCAFVFGGIWLFWKRRLTPGLVFASLLGLFSLFSHNISENCAVIILYGLLIGISTRCRYEPFSPCYRN